MKKSQVNNEEEGNPCNEDSIYKWVMVCNGVWLCPFIIPHSRGLRQKDSKLEPSLGNLSNLVSTGFKKN